MDIFYWVMIGVLVAFVAKVQLPTDDGENMAVLLAIGILGAVVSGMVVHTFIRTGFLSMGWVSHLAAFLGAVMLVLGLRVVTKQHLA